MSAPTCGPQQPGTVPSPFKWQGLAAATTAITILGVIIGYAHKIIAWLGIVATVGEFVVAAAAALAILALVFYYAFQADGCIVSPSKGEPICLSGIIQDTTDLHSSAINILAPFAIGPAGVFDLVVKTVYFGYVSTNSYYNFCNGIGAPMLPCIIKDETACGAKIGALAGAVVGAVAGTIAGAVAGTVITTAISASAFCALSVIFYVFCVLIAIIVAAIVAAVIAYTAAAIGGAIGKGIAGATNGNAVGDAWKALQPGAIVTVQGNWVTNPDVGNNELLYATSISRTAQMPSPPDYSTADADGTAADDCPVALPPIG